jgi:hypothetical protein
MIEQFYDLSRPLWTQTKGALALCRSSLPGWKKIKNTTTENAEGFHGLARGAAAILCGYHRLRMDDAGRGKLEKCSLC